LRIRDLPTVITFLAAMILVLAPHADAAPPPKAIAPASAVSGSLTQRPVMPTAFMRLEQARVLPVGAIVLGSDNLDVRLGVLDNLELRGQIEWNPGFSLGTESKLTGALATRLGGKVRLIEAEAWSLAVQGSLMASTEATKGTVFQGSVPVTWNLDARQAFHIVPDLTFAAAGPSFLFGVGYEQIWTPNVRFILVDQTVSMKVLNQDQLSNILAAGLRFSLGTNWTVDATMGTTAAVLSPFSLSANATILGLTASYGAPSWSALRQLVGL